MDRPARRALTEGWPVLLSVIVVGLTFGVVARQSGLGLVEVSAMSIVIFAGASQFAAVELLRSGAGVAAVVAAVFLVNLRHALMGAALRSHFAGRSLLQRLGLAYLLTDEAFALGVGWRRRGGTGVRYYVVFGAGLWLAWNLATLTGALASDRIVEPRRFGVDFAITASFLAIVVLSLRRRGDEIVALVAIAASAALALAGASLVAVIAAGALAPAVVLVRRDEGR